MRRRRRGIVRSAALRRDAFSLLNGISMGLRSGEYLGQIAKRRTARFNGLAYASSFVRSKIVYYDDILALEDRGQTLFDIGQELGPVH